MSIIKATPELLALDESKATVIRKAFEPMVNMLEQFEEAYKSVTSEAEPTLETTKKAKRLRLDIAKVRVSADKVRKEQKEEYLRAGKAIDGVFNVLKWAVSDKEEALKKIEKHFEEKERVRLEALQVERVELISEYVEDTEALNLGSMAEDVFEAYLEKKKTDKIARIEAEKEAERKRIEEEAEAMRAESERIKEEARMEAQAQVEAEKNINKANAEEKAKAVEKENALNLEKAKLEAAEKERKLQKEKEAKVIAEEKSRQENFKMQTKKKTEAKTFLISLGITEEQAVSIVKANIKKQIPHFSFNF